MLSIIEIELSLFSLFFPLSSLFFALYSFLSILFSLFFSLYSFIFILSIRRIIIRPYLFPILNTTTLNLFLPGEFHRFSFPKTETDPKSNIPTLFPVIPEIIGGLLGYALEDPGSKYIANTQIDYGLPLQNFLSCPKIHKNILGNFLL